MPRTPHTKDVSLLQSLFLTGFTVSFLHVCLQGFFSLLGTELLWSYVNLPQDWSQTAENAATGKSCKSQQTRNFCSKKIQFCDDSHAITSFRSYHHTSQVTWFYWSETCKWPKQPPLYLIPEIYGSFMSGMLEQTAGFSMLQVSLPITATQDSIDSNLMWMEFWHQMLK